MSLGRYRHWIRIAPILILSYTDEVNLIGDDIRRIGRNADVLLNPCKDEYIGLAVNIRKANYMNTLKLSTSCKAHSVSGLYCIDGVVIAALMLCYLFEIYCAPPNLGILGRGLNFAQRPIFSGLRLFNEPKISLGTPSIKSFPEDLCSRFLRPEKIHRLQPGLNTRTLDPEASMLLRDHRSRHIS